MNDEQLFLVIKIVHASPCNEFEKRKRHLLILGQIDGRTMIFTGLLKGNVTLEK